MIGVGVSAWPGRAGGTRAAPETHVFVLGGQSNMVGRADFDGGAGYPDGVLQYSQSGTLIPAASPLDHLDERAGDMGLALQFCIDYAAAHAGIRVVLVPCADGGTSFAANQWGVGNPLSNALIARTNQVFADNPDFVLKGLLWHQGESDVGYAPYQAELQAQFQAFRAQITAASASTPIVLGRLLPEWTSGNASRLATDAIIADIPNRIAHTAVADSAGLIGFDGLHFDAASLRAFGSRYLAALDLAQANLPDDPVLPAETEAEAGALAHYLLGDDNPGDLDVLGGQALTGPAPIRSAGYLTPQAGPGTGLSLPLLDRPSFTMVFVLRRAAASTRGIIGGTLFQTSGNSHGWSPYFENAALRFNDRNGAGNLFVESVADFTAFTFLAVSVDAAAGTCLFYRGDATEPRVDLRSGISRAFDPATAVDVALGDVHYNSAAFAAACDFAEVLYFDGAKSVEDLEAIYARSVVRLAPRGIALQ